MSTAVSETQHPASHRKRFGDVSYVAELLDVPASTVYERVRQKRIGGVVRFGRHIRFDLDRLERWLEAGGEGK